MLRTGDGGSIGDLTKGQLTARIDGKYNSTMREKTSITLPSEVLTAIDRHRARNESRSRFLEIAAREHLARLERKQAEQQDIQRINRNAEVLNAEAEDALSYQVPL